MRQNGLERVIKLSILRVSCPLSTILHVDYAEILISKYSS